MIPFTNLRRRLDNLELILDGLGKYLMDYGTLHWDLVTRIELWHYLLELTSVPVDLTTWI